MKYHVSILAVALSSTALRRAAAAAARGGGGGANWYLRASDGSSQGPYGLSELGQWSSAGYVSRDSQVQWGAGGIPQPLSSVLGGSGSGGGGSSGGRFGGAVGGGSSEGGRRGDDETSEEGGYNYKAAASQLWGDDSEDEPYGSPGGGRGSGGPGGGARDQWGSLISSKVTAVEGGRWSESVTAAKGTLKKMFAVGRKSNKGRGDNSSRQANGGRGRGRGRGRGSGGRSRGGTGGRGGRYPQGARGVGRGGRAYSAGSASPSYGDPSGGAGYGRHDSYGGGTGQDRAGAGAWDAGGWGEGTGSGPGSGGWGGGGRSGGGSLQPADVHAPPSSPATATSNHPQRAGDVPNGAPISEPADVAAAAAAASSAARNPAYPPPPPPPPSSLPQDLPPSRDDQGQGKAWDGPGAGGDGDGGGGGADSGGGAPGGVNGAPSITGEGLGPPLQPVAPPGEPYPPFTTQHADGADARLQTDGASGVTPPNAGTLAADGLDAKEIEAFYAAQEDYGGGGGRPSSAIDAQPLKRRRGWAGRRSKTIPKEDLAALGLDYGEAEGEDRPGPGTSGGRRRSGGWFSRRKAKGGGGGGGGRRGAVLGGRISVDSMKLKYEEGWDAEAEGEGVLAAVKSAAGRSLSRVTTSPSRAVASMAPVGAARLLARAGGVFPLLLWWAFTVARGVLPVLMSWLVSRLMMQLADYSAGRYTLSPSHYRDSRLACFKLVGQQAGAGVLLAAVTGVVRGWLRPRAREKSAALCRRALVGVSVAGGGDRPSAAEFQQLSLAPWEYTRQAMELSKAVAGVGAVAAVLHTVWPLRGPAALGGIAVILLAAENLALWLAEGHSAPARPAGDVTEELSGGIQGGAVASAEAEARGLRQVLLTKNAALLEAAEEMGRKARVLTYGDVLRGSLAWLVMGACAIYALVSVVEEELAFQFGTARVTLVITQVWLAQASLQAALSGVRQLATLRAPSLRMQRMALAGEDSGWSKDASGAATEGGWSNDGPETADGLRLQGVSLTPIGRTRQALSGVDLHAPAGSVVAVVGGAGSGKTALVQLSLGLVKADAGEAMFQGRPLQEWEAGAYRERVAWLNQVPGRFALSAGENIGAGDASEFSNRELWARAAGVSGASVAIESLPLGYDTLLEEGGSLSATEAPTRGVGATGRSDRSGLSEGEWQRLHLARFLMRADVAKLLVLDEPFKGVSPAEASRMLGALGAQARATGQVVMVASQELSVGRWADVTVYLEDGRVVEAGRWDDLLASGGSFASAVREHDAF